MKIILADINKELCDYWNYYFQKFDNVSVVHGSAFELEADAMISPANSFGIMNGGIDRLISEYFGWHLQETVQLKIKTEFDGELLVGQSMLVETGHIKIPYLISAPTMRVPLDIRNTANVYLCMKSIILTAKKHNLNSIIIPGLGTGCGNVPYHICAAQMQHAYKDFYLDGYVYPKTIVEANENHMKRI
jgi:O-acetyl-ADP-ribose deacetylase (regulator of RNase III)